MITSGNEATDRLFERVIDTLNSDKVWAIFLREKVLFWNEKEKKYEYIYGRKDDKDDGTFEITLSKSKHKNRNEIAKTLLHEMIHIIYPEKDEDDVLILEDFYWNKFSGEQKKILESYVPKRISKSKP